MEKETVRISSWEYVDFKIFCIDSPQRPRRALRKADNRLAAPKTTKAFYFSPSASSAISAVKKSLDSPQRPRRALRNMLLETKPPSAKKPMWVFNNFLYLCVLCELCGYSL
jgi:hypothetical protein